MILARNAAALGLVGLLLAGCGGHTAGTTHTGANTPAMSAAKALLREAVLPPGSRSQPLPVGQGLGAAPERPICTPLIDLSSRWISPGSLSSIQGFLRDHAAPGHGPVGYGTVASAAGNLVTIVDFTPSDSQSLREELLYSFVPLGAHDVALRVDAQVVPPGAQCTNPGGPNRT